MNTCRQCKHLIDDWNKQCGGCGMRLVLEPDEEHRAKYLRGPALGAMLFTQGWTLGARLYVWFLFSIIPVVGIVALVVTMFFGRRWSWKYGGWSDWDTFTKRMKLLDGIAVVWVVLLVAMYVLNRYV